MSQHEQYGQPTIADPSALRALDARHVRQYSFYFVLIGLSAVVLALLLSVTSLLVALVAGFAVVAACVGALASFIKGHVNVPARFSRLAAIFWGVWLLGVVLSVLGATLWDRHPAAIWGGGILALASGLAVGHLVNRSADAQADPGTPTRVH
ncbi:hypothetical protein [Luteococcus peritonei]|uniref:Uncharacterized protein n=1 Tax=Luteococcus peritonei TaxID=88874 RepID=A0ABW4RU13_9ACTN